MSKKGTRQAAADTTVHPGAVDVDAEAREKIAPALGLEDRTNGAFGETPVTPPAAVPARPTAADLVAKVLGDGGAAPAVDLVTEEVSSGVIQLDHGGASLVGDPSRNPPALTTADLDELAPRLRLPGGAPVRRESLNSASRHTKGLVVVLSNRVFVAKGVRV